MRARAGTSGDPLDVVPVHQLVLVSSAQLGKTYLRNPLTQTRSRDPTKDLTCRCDRSRPQWRPLRSSVSASPRLQAAPPAAPNLSIGVDAAASKSSIDVAAADKILKGLRHELAANESLNSYLESVTGEAVPVGYTATQLTFREFGRDLHETDRHSWYAVFTYVLVDEAG